MLNTVMAMADLAHGGQILACEATFNSIIWPGPAASASGLSA